MYRFVAIGEAMIELFHQNEFSLSLGFAGDTLNVCRYLAHYQEKTQVNISYATALGCDYYSNKMVTYIKQQHIDDTWIIRFKDKLPGLYLIKTDDVGERDFYYYRSESAARSLFQGAHVKALCEALVKYDFIYLTGITLAILDDDSRDILMSVLYEAKLKGSQIIFDMNYRQKLWPDKRSLKKIVGEIVPLVDIIMTGFSEEQLVHGDLSIEDTAMRWQKAGAKEVIIKNGGKPCLVGLDELTFVSPEKIDVVIDTTAAGDAFNAAYLASRWQGGSPIDAAKYAHQLAAKVVQVRGATLEGV